MGDNPLLIFKAPVKENREKKRGSSFTSFYNTPVVEKQDSRLGPQFDILRKAFEDKSIQPQTSTNGLELEFTVVMEIIGSHENFISITRNIEGLEWLGEFDGDEIEPDDDFYLVDKDTKEKITDKNLKSKLFLTMANQRAIDELLSLWNLYKENPEGKLGKGKEKLKEVFKNLYEIRRWSVQDRLEANLLIKNWEYRIKNNEENLPIEIELWFRNNLQKRQGAENLIQNLIRQLGGNIITTSVIPEIRYHAILATIPASKFNNFKDDIYGVELLKSDEIMFVKTVPQSIGDDKCVDFVEDFQVTETPSPEIKDCVLAVFDGVPSVNHEALKNYILLNDVDDLVPEYTVENMKHGTAICSLIVNGDLDHHESKISRKIYVRPILTVNNNNELIPNKFLPVDLTFRAVKEIFAEGSEVAGKIKIINLSVGDIDRQFNKTMSAWARLIDYLSWKYKILFCISAGNYAENLDIARTYGEWKDLNTQEKDIEVLKCMLNADINRKILSPAEAVNAITVGALHSDILNESCNIHNQVELITNNNLPSTITRFGLGLRNSIKPDISVEGGRQLYSEPISDTKEMTGLEVSKVITKNPGICVAAPNNKLRYCKGTSFSCALTSRNAVKIYDTLERIGYGSNSNIAVLIKTLLIHGADWNDCEDILKNIYPPPDWHKYKRAVTKMIGYGKPNFDKVLGCTNQQATAVAINYITKDESHIYEFPMPPSLSGRREWLRLNLSVGWFSPLNFNNAKYKKAKIWVDIDTDEKFQQIQNNKKGVDVESSKRGTIQHQIYEGEQALAFVDGDSLKVKISCISEDGLVFQEPIPYGLAFTLEVKEDVDIQVYQEVKDRIQIRPRVQAPV